MKNAIQMRLTLAVVLLTLAACSGKNPLTGSGTITYRVNGSATRASLTYEAATGSTSQQANVALPWSTTRSAKSGDFLYISAQNTGQTGCVNVEIISGDKTLQSSQSCGAFVIATASTTY